MAAGAHGAHPRMKEEELAVKRKRRQNPARIGTAASSPGVIGVHVRVSAAATTTVRRRRLSGSRGRATEIGEPEGELNLVAWAGYAEDGSYDPKVDWVTDFEKETGCEVNVKVGNTSDEMVQLIEQGGYDGVSASGDASGRLYAGGDVQPVNTDLVPNYADIADELKDQPYNTFDGVNYGIPNDRGWNVLDVQHRRGQARAEVMGRRSSRVTTTAAR